jgi:hypothetical protein
MGSWADPGPGGFIWIRDALPRDAPQLRVWTYGYDSRLRDEETIADVYEWAEGFRLNLRVLMRHIKVMPTSRPS